MTGAGLRRGRVETVGVLCSGASSFAAPLKHNGGSKPIQPHAEFGPVQTASAQTSPVLEPTIFNLKREAWLPPQTPAELLHPLSPSPPPWRSALPLKWHKMFGVGREQHDSEIDIPPRPLPRQYVAFLGLINVIDGRGEQQEGPLL
ncbi:hypothetical protein Q8A67_019468 [Cirrhinus molitorella]|uniref:Uncharacterized protein n=1 Tax=Cirrhinus molitorella TaxID=172907 RepID=A0AA88PFK6_9TELE|nr:hypothetical protein Q8A67_019468 [Cirrhinus molitorella]